MSKARTLANLVSGASTSTLPNSALTNSAVTINSQSVSLGGSVTLATETQPTVSGINPSVIENTQTANDQRKAVEVEEFDDEIPF